MFDQSINGTSANGNVNAILMKDGTERLLEWYDSPLRDADGRNIGLLCAGIDVTVRHRLEKEVINNVEEERRRIATDLHDGLGSLLVGISLRAELLTNNCSTSTVPPSSKPAELTKLIRDAIDQVSSIAQGLYPLGNDPEDLMSHLSNLIHHRNPETTSECRFECRYPVLIDDPKVANHLYRIAQEAFNNAIKYSNAHYITVSLFAEEGQVVLEILDDGEGIDPGKLKKKGLGLHVMNYRANAICATLVIEPRYERGIRVLCTVPPNPVEPCYEATF